MSTGRGCGFGCIAHKLAYDFILAIGLNRTLVLAPTEFSYHKNGWEAAFLPISRNCSFNYIRSSKCSQHHVWFLRQQMHKIFMTEICICLWDLCKIPVKSHGVPPFVMVLVEMVLLIVFTLTSGSDNRRYFKQWLLFL